MSNTKTIPNPKSKAADSKLIEDLITLSERKGKKALVKSSTYDAPGDPEIRVRSWKMDEYKYYDVPSPFPSLVRGLFTVDLPGNKNKEYRIVCRGYDKFFNIGEVPWTTWDGLAHHTAAPYTLSLKSNGCIIFIGALTPSKILVTSKHSLGKLPGKQSHAQVGERWLRKYFEKLGKTEEQFAKVLWDNNWTAIAELCDDSFEEHVLAIPEELTGLHLHGINECTKAFKTMSHDIVDAFAEEWGFIKTLSTTVDTIEEVRKFTSEIGEIGHWNGQAVEGFVVRTHVAEPPDNTTQKSRSPYPPGSTFFFKVKFDEPYMMYRDWREVTKKLLGSAGPLSAASLPKSKLRRPETKMYVNWVIEEIRRDKSQFADYNKGHGIIATRERFLAWMKTKGKDEAAVAPVSPTNSASPKIFGKTIIVPVAIPGCGKTTVAIALADIFSWGHTQSDDVRAKKAAPVFLKNVHNLLKQRDVVIADKNNHLIMHRQQLRDLAKDFKPPPRLLALNWSWNLSAKSPAIVHKICGDRILVRGEKHQSLHGDSKTKSHESVVWQFINNAEELADSEVDASVDMEMEDTMEQSIRRAVEGCAKILGIEIPSEDKIQAGIKKAFEYSPVVAGQPKGKGKGKDQGKPKEARPAKAQPPRYYGLVPELNVVEAFNGVMKDEEFWKKLVANGQFTKKPHVTIVHKKNLPDDGPLWERSRELLATSSPPSFEITLGNLVWNNRIIAATVDNLRIAPGSGDEGQKGADFIKQLSEEARNRLHITLGMADTKVNAIEAKDLVEKWRNGKAAEDAKSKRLDGVVTLGKLQGLFA